MRAIERAKVMSLVGGVLATLMGFSQPLFSRTTAATFLRISPSVKERGMGMTGVSHAEGAGAGWWNPARLCFGKSQVRLGVLRWIADGRGSWGSAKLTFPHFGLGIYYFNLTTPGFEARELPGPPEALFDLQQAYLAVSGAYKLGAQWAVGLSLKGYLEDIYGDRWTGFPIWDLGLSWEIGNWRWGGSVHNLGPDQRGYPLPTSFKTGVARLFVRDKLRVLTATEAEFITTQFPIYNWGAEIGWEETLFLRGGLWGRIDLLQWVVGGGFQFRNWTLDLSYSPLDEILGSRLRVGVGFIWQ
ncbi:MAG: hypothetical protein ACK4OO_05240 [bacterium]